MVTIDVDGGFDVHEYRSDLKLLRQDGSTTIVADRSELGCPACGEPFDRLLATENDSFSFDSGPDGPICVLRPADQLLVVAHES